MALRSVPAVRERKLSFFEAFRDPSVTRNGPVAESVLARRSEGVVHLTRLHADLFYLSIGTVCNHACLYCLNGSHRRSFATTEGLVQSLELAYALGMRKVALVGGEPTIRKDLAHLASTARSLGSCS